MSVMLRKTCLIPGFIILKMMEDMSSFFFGIH